MRSLLLFTLVLLLAGLPACGGGSFRVTRTGNYSFDKTGEKRTSEDSGALDGPVVAIDISHEFGVVQVFGTDGPAEYSWTLSCWGRTPEDAERFLTEIRLEQNSAAGAHRFRLVLPEQPGNALRGVESMLTLRVPHETAVRVANSFGDAEVTGISGAVRGDCSHCSVELEDLSGTVDWETSFDDLRARRIAGGSLRNAHGELHVETVAGDLIAKTSFDDATIANVAGTLVATNEHGELTVTGVGGELTAETSFADLVVSELGGAVTLRNSHGEIRAEGVSGEVKASTSFAKVVINAASERVKIQNSHGDVQLALVGQRLREIELETSFADVALSVPAGLHPAVMVDQKHGDLKSPLPVLVGGARPSRTDSGTLHLKVRHGDIKIEETTAVTAESPVRGG